MHTIGLYDKKLQEHLLRESSLDLNKMVEVCRIVEVTCSQAHVIQHSTAVNPDYNVNKIHRQFSNNQESQKESPDLIRKCKFCSFFHKTDSCPAYGKLCDNWKNKNHFAKCCNAKKVNNVHKYQDHTKSDENSKIFEIEALFRPALKSCTFPIHWPSEIKNCHMPPREETFFAISLSKKIYDKKI